MNYKKLYDNLIKSRKNRNINEITYNHHIIPKSCGR